MIPLGAGPRPSDGASLATRVADAVAHAAGIRPDDVRVQAGLGADGDVEMVAVDLTGAVLEERHLQGSAVGRPPAPAPSDPRTTLGSLLVTGAPVRLLGAPVELRLEVHRLLVAWARDAADALWLVAVDEASAQGPAEGRLSVAGDVRAAVDALTAVASTRAAQQGVGLRDVEVTPSSAGRNHVRVDLRATVTKSFLKSPVTASVEIDVDDDLVLRVRRLDAAVAGFLGSVARPVIDRELAPWRGREVHLRDLTFAGAHPTAVRLDLEGGTYRFEADLGA